MRFATGPRTLLQSAIADQNSFAAHACSFTLITRTARVLAPATLAALPSTRAIPDRDVFYVADPISSIQIFAGDTPASTVIQVMHRSLLRQEAPLRRAKSGL
jgi:hypothetical protein